MESRNEEFFDEESIPHECFCPITQEIMEDPVMAQDGHTYERSAIKEWFDRGHRNSPKTGARLLSIELTPNHGMRSLIEDLKSNLPVLARHKLNEKSIEAAIKLREEEMQLMLEEKGNLLNQEQEKRSKLEKELEIMRNKTAQLSLQPSREKEAPTAESTLLLQLLQAQQLQMQKQTELMEKMQQRIEQLETKPAVFFPTPQSNPSRPMVTGITPLQAAVQLSSMPAAKPSEPIFHSETLLEAAQSGHLTTVQWLLRERGANPTSEKDNYGRTALLWAAYGGHTAIVECLLGHGANVSEKDNYGRTALLWAAYGGHTAIVECLLGHGASLSEKDNKGMTALLWAAYGGHTATVECLLGHGANVSEKKTNDGWTALLWAAVGGHTATVECLLGHGASLSEKTNDGWTTLLWAAVGGHTATVECLLGHGASLSEKTNDGWTALLLAAYGGHTATVEWLLYHGASLSEKDNNGKTALDLASKLELKEFLINYRPPIKLSTNPSRFVGNQNSKSVPQQQTPEEPQQDRGGRCMIM